MTASQDRAAWTGATLDYRTDGLHTLAAAEVSGDLRRRARLPRAHRIHRRTVAVLSRAAQGCEGSTERWWQRVTLQGGQGQVPQDDGYARR